MKITECDHHNSDFSQKRIFTTVSSHAKWILSGEHAVIRGGKAIAFPLKKYECCICVQKAETLAVNQLICTDNAKNNGNPCDSICNELNQVLLMLLNNAAAFVGIDISQIKYNFFVTNNIPLNSGLGSSAAICVNIAKIFSEITCFDDVFSLAKHLENYFHTKSSGLDIATVIMDKPIVFQNNKTKCIFEPIFWPPMILTYSGIKSRTYKCTEIVKQIFHKNEKLGLMLDETMSEASNLCEQGLQNADFNKLKEGISLGSNVFKEWNLIDEHLHHHIEMLKNHGAVAAKPIGSGLGGYVVSLWEEYPRLDKDIYLTLDKP